MKKLGKFEVGQIWLDNTGNSEVITEITEDYYYPIVTNAGVYTKNGRNDCGYANDLEILISKDMSLKVTSCDFPIAYHKGKFHAGCQRISKQDALKIFKFLGEHLGYEVEG